MSRALEDYHRLAARAFDAWDRLIGDPNCPEAEAEVAALETRLDALDAEIRVIARTYPPFRDPDWPDWMLEMAGEGTDEAAP